MNAINSELPAGFVRRASSTEMPDFENGAITVGRDKGEEQK